MSRGGRAWLIVVLAAMALAAVATFTSAPGEVVADARYEHIAEPAQFFARHTSVWDDERSLGAPTKYFSPVVGGAQALVAATGAPPWAIERATHAGFLALAAVGAVALFRALTAESPATVAQRWWVAGLAGALYAFSPYTSQFLTPSGLFLPYTLAPWMALAALRGVHRDPWRWAALFAVAVFSVGMLNTSSLILAMVPAAALAVTEVVGGSVSLRRAVAWTWRAGLLTLAVSLPALVALGLNGPVVRANLETTETVETVAATTSASESWRGLGQWLSYFRFAGDVVRDQAEPFFTNAAVIVAAFAVVALAGLGLARAADRRFAVLAVLAAVAVTVMVGIHPVGDASPFGRLLGRGYDSSLFLRGFRSTYKAGPGLGLAISFLAAAGVAHLVALRAWWWRALAAAGVAAAVVASFPFWTGNLYPESDRHDEIPDYWDDAFAWFDEQPHEPGVLVVPSLARTPYRWGYLNDTLFDAYLPQPAVAARSLPQSTDELAVLTEAMDEYLGSSIAEPGVLAPVLRRLGVRWVLVQNDVDWQAAGVPRPSSYSVVRDDPELSLVASFGEPGLNVTAPVSFDRSALPELRLPPLEIYEVVDAAPAARTASNPIAVLGAGEAWPALAATGWLDHAVVAAADVDVADDLAAVVVTDGNQRRAGRVVSSQSLRSHVLALGEDIGRVVQALDDDPAAQTYAIYGDAAMVTATGYGRGLVVWESKWRAAGATDGNPWTAWAAPGNAGDVLRVDLATPTALTGIELTGFVEAGDVAGSIATVGIGRIDAEARVHAVELIDGGAARLDLDPAAGAVAWVSVQLSPGDAAGGLVGLTELVLDTAAGPLDTREALRVPELGAIVDGPTPVHYVFTRSIDGRGFDEQATVDRVFDSGASVLESRARVRVRSSAPDAAIEALVGAPIRAVASGRYLDLPDALGSAAVDGHVGTAWQLDADGDDSLTITLPPAPVDEVEIWAITATAGGRRSRAAGYDVAVERSDGSIDEIRVELEDAPECDPGFASIDDETCVERIVVPVDSGPTVSAVEIRPTDVVGAGTGIGAAPVQIAEVRVRAAGEELTDAGRTPDRGCRPLLEIDGVVVGMRPLGDPTPAALADGLEFESCEPVELDAGTHLLRSDRAASYAVDWVRLDPVGVAAVPPGETGAVAVSGNSTDRDLGADVERGDIVVSGIPAHDGWRLSASLPGTRLVVDGFEAWQADAAGAVTIDMRFAPQRWYRLGWLVAAPTLALALWLLLPGRRIADTEVDGEAGAPTAATAGDGGNGTGMRPRTWTPVVVGVAASGFIAAGWWGALLGLAAGAAVVRAPGVVLAAAVVAPAVLAFATVVEGSLDAERVQFFVAERPRSHELGLAMIVVWVAAGLVVWRRSPPAHTVDGPRRGRAPRWILVALVVLALASVALGVQ